MSTFRRAMTIGVAAAAISLGFQPAQAQNAEQGSPQQLAQSSAQKPQQQLEQAHMKLQQVQQTFERATGAATDLSAAKQSARDALSQAETALKQMQQSGGQQMQEAAKKAEASIQDAMQTIDQADPQQAAQALKETNNALASVGQQASSSGAAGSAQASGQKPASQAVQQSRQAEQQMERLAQQGDKLIGKKLVGADQQEVGEVSNIVMGQDGKLSAVLVDVGGFLGIGSKTIAIPSGQLQIQGEQVIASKLTKDTAESMPEYEQKPAEGQQGQQKK